MEKKENERKDEGIQGYLYFLSFMGWDLDGGCLVNAYTRWLRKACFTEEGE